MSPTQNNLPTNSFGGLVISLQSSITKTRLYLLAALYHVVHRHCTHDQISAEGAALQQAMLGHKVTPDNVLSKTPFIANLPHLNLTHDEEVANSNMLCMLAAQWRCLTISFSWNCTGCLDR